MILSTIKQTDEANQLLIHVLNQSICYITFESILYITNQSESQ